MNAVYVFDVEGEGKWHVDLTSGKGEIGKGDPTNKPDVTIVVNKETFLKVPSFFFYSTKEKINLTNELCFLFLQMK